MSGGFLLFNFLPTSFIYENQVKVSLYIFSTYMKVPMICLYALLDTKTACIFTKTQLASGVHVVKTS